MSNAELIAQDPGWVIALKGVIIFAVCVPHLYLNLSKRLVFWKSSYIEWLQIRSLFSPLRFRDLFVIK